MLRALMALALVAMLGADWWLVRERSRYEVETARLRAGMSGVEKRRADAVLADRENRLRLMIALVERQARGEQELHLSIAMDSGRMRLQQRGATLREMSVDVGADRTIGAPPDTVRLASPRGQRRVERVLAATDRWDVPPWVYRDRRLAPPADRALAGALGPVAIILTGGTIIYSLPAAGPLHDSTYVLPGGIRARASDLAAIVPDLTPGTPIYLY